MNRRSILKGAAALGIGGRSIVERVMDFSPSAFNGAETGMDAQPAEVPWPSDGGPWTKTGLTKAAWNALGRQMREAEERYRVRRQYRVAGLDPDIFERQSGAGWWRAQMQMRRDKATAKRIKDMRLKIWPDVTEEHW